MPESPAEPVAGPAAVLAAAGPVQPAPARWRLVAAVLGGLALLVALAVIARELIAARVPQHRAALEELIRHETGLEVSFSQLSVRWGWYGPEAVFHRVALGELGAPALLRAPELSVSLDAWRMVRSGHLEAGRITLLNPDIDLTAGATPRAVAPASGAAARAGLIAEVPRLLSRWRGGRIDIEGGALRWLAPDTGRAVSVDLRRAGLRRRGADWSADVQLLLPDSLGASARLTLRLSGDLMRTEELSGSLTFEGERLAFGGWRALDVYPQLARYLPQGGSGNLKLRASIARGRLIRMAGTLHADALEWPALAHSGRPLTLPRLRADWQLALEGEEWHLAVGALDLGTQLPGAATVTLAGDTARGSLQQAPLPAVAALARWYLPQLPLGELALGGRLASADFDWDGRRRAGTRLAVSAQLEGLSLASAAQGVLLEGLSARLTASEGHLSADLSAPGARLTLARAQPVALDGLELSTRLTAALSGTQWQLGTDNLSVRRGEARLTAQVLIGAPDSAAAPRVDATLQIRDAEAPLLASLVGPRALAAFGTTAARLTSGRIVGGMLDLHGTLGDGTAADDALRSAHGEFALEDAVLAAAETWPEVRELAAHVQWQGARVQASLTRALSGSLQLSAARAQWDAGREQPLRLSGRLRGSAADLLQWLRARPELAAYAPGVQYLDVRGDTLLEVDLLVPGSAAHQPPARTRITAVLDGASLRPLAGLPAIDALRGTLAFSGGHLQHSMLTGAWLGGPVSLGVGERRERGTTSLAVTGRGLLEVRQALLATGGDGDATALSGNAEWSALLTLVPQAEGAAALAGARRLEPHRDYQPPARTAREGPGRRAAAALGSAGRFGRGAAASRHR